MKSHLMGIASTFAALGLWLCAPSTVSAATVTVDAGNAAGTTQALGAIDPSDHLTITVDGIAFEQSPQAYGTNPAGVVVVAGTSGVGAATNFTTAGDGVYGAGTYDFGSLLATLTDGSFTKTVQIFGADSANGLGSGSPPTSLQFSGTLGDLFGSFADAPGATLTFVVADNLYPDNSGAFSVDVAGVPEPATWALLFFGVGIVGTGLRMGRRRGLLASSAA
jgi:PEP-CTERM motif